MSTFRLYRPSLMALALLALLAGMWGGLQRVGWPLPALSSSSFAAFHGPLMVVGLLGTVISLERAVALERGWAYTAPLLHAIGGLCLVIGVRGSLAAIPFVAASLSLCAIFAILLRQQPQRFMQVMALGALCLLIGNLLWLTGWPFAAVACWWMVFLTLTIAGERLELGRLRQLPQRIEFIFLVPVALMLLGLLVMLVFPSAGVRLLSVGFIGMAWWLLRYDLARRTIRKAGLTRYIAVCLLSGYGWLIVSGLIGLVNGALTAGPLYDALLHAVFVGFVFAMIFGHAPIILPALLKVPFHFSPWLYGVLALLHTSLLVRIMGDISGITDMRRWGSMLNALTLLLFLGAVIWAVHTAKRLQPCISKPASLSKQP